MKIFKYAAIWLLLAGCLISCKKEDEIPEDAYTAIVYIYNNPYCGIQLHICVGGDCSYLIDACLVPENLPNKYIIEADRYYANDGLYYKIQIIYRLTGEKVTTANCGQYPIINIIKIKKI